MEFKPMISLLIVLSLAVPVAPAYAHMGPEAQPPDPLTVVQKTRCTKFTFDMQTSLNERLTRMLDEKDAGCIFNELAAIEKLVFYDPVNQKESYLSAMNQIQGHYNDAVDAKNHEHQARMVDLITALQSRWIITNISFLMAQDPDAGLLTIVGVGSVSLAVISVVVSVFTLILAKRSSAAVNAATRLSRISRISRSGSFRQSVGVAGRLFRKFSSRFMPYWGPIATRIGLIGSARASAKRQKYKNRPLYEISKEGTAVITSEETYYPSPLEAIYLEDGASNPDSYAQDQLKKDLIALGIGTGVVGVIEYSQTKKLINNAKGWTRFAGEKGFGRAAMASVGRFLGVWGGPIGFAITFVVTMYAAKAIKAVMDWNEWRERTNLIEDLQNKITNAKSDAEAYVLAQKLSTATMEFSRYFTEALTVERQSAFDTHMRQMVCVEMARSSVSQEKFDELAPSLKMYALDEATYADMYKAFERNFAVEIKGMQTRNEELVSQVDAHLTNSKRVVAKLNKWFTLDFVQFMDFQNDSNWRLVDMREPVAALKTIVDEVRAEVLEAKRGNPMKGIGRNKQTYDEINEEFNCANSMERYEFYGEDY